MTSGKDSGAADMIGTTDFGVRLRRLREQRGLDETAVARHALGDAGTATQVRDFANYLSRIERTNANIRHEKLREIMKGLGFTTMSAFWRAIEQEAGSHDATMSLPTALAAAIPLFRELQNVVAELDPPTRTAVLEVIALAPILGLRNPACVPSVVNYVRLLTHVPAPMLRDYLKAAARLHGSQ